MKPLAPDRYALRFMVGKSTHDKLRHVQALLSHRLHSGHIAEVFDRALDALIVNLEKQGFAATDKPRPRSGGSSTGARHIPANVKRAVWKRDQGRCTLVGDGGQRLAMIDSSAHFMGQSVANGADSR